MELHPHALYKVVEIGRGIAIINALDKSVAPDSVELISAEPMICMKYLMRYVHARCRHKNIVQAHTEAVFGLRVTDLMRSSYER